MLQFYGFRERADLEVAIVTVMYDYAITMSVEEDLKGCWFRVLKLTLEKWEFWGKQQSIARSTHRKGGHLKLKLTFSLFVRFSHPF